MFGRYDDLTIVGEASEGKEAIKKALDLVPDVVVTEVVIPNIDGLEATRRIINKNPKIKVLILTQHDNKEHVLSAIKAGANGYLPKSAIGSELVSAVRALHNGDSFLDPSAAAVIVHDYRRQAKKESSDLLTAREREILVLISEGYSSRKISTILLISFKTVINHRTSIMEKLDTHKNTDLIKYAIRKGLVNVNA
jgi:DNA-binding NarL/FixJ family response regulator